MRDDIEDSVNVLGEPLKPCSFDPMTGFYRDGCCNTGPEDRGRHTVCVRVTEEFLAFSRRRGNDLSTPRPEFGLPRPPARRPLVPLRRPLARGRGRRRRAEGRAGQHPRLGAPLGPPRGAASPCHAGTDAVPPLTLGRPPAAEWPVRPERSRAKLSIPTFCYAYALCIRCACPVHQPRGPRTIQCRSSDISCPRHRRSARCGSRSACASESRARSCPAPAGTGPA